MSTKAEALRTAIAALSALLAIEEGKPAGTYLGQILPTFDTDAAERQRLAEIAESIKPHAWRDWEAGVPPGQVGDNDPVDPELLRVFRPFHDAATREGVEDSAGARFFLPTIKKRAGIGPKASGVIRDETRRLWESKWGEDWRAHEANIAAGHVPKAEDVARIFGKVYG